MADLKETCFNCVGKDDFDELHDFYNRYPDILLEQIFGIKLLQCQKYILRMYIKLSPPRQVDYTDEQKAAIVERLVAARNK